MLCIKFTKKERCPDQRIDRAKIGPDTVAFAWRHDGQDRVLDLPKAGLQTIMESIKKGAKGSVPCGVTQTPDRYLTARLEGGCVHLAFTENGVTETVRLSVKSLQVLKTFLAEK